MQKLSSCMENCGYNVYNSSRVVPIRVTCVPLLDGLLFLCGLWLPDLTQWFDKCHPMHRSLLHPEQTDKSCRKYKWTSSILRFMTSQDRYIAANLYQPRLLYSLRISIILGFSRLVKYYESLYTVPSSYQVHLNCQVFLWKKTPWEAFAWAFARFREVWIGAHFSIVWHCTSTSSESYPAILGSTKPLAMLEANHGVFCWHFLLSHVVLDKLKWKMLKET